MSAALLQLAIPASIGGPGRKPITTGREIAQRISGLAQSLEALLKSSTAKAIVALAKEAGCQDQINTAVDFLIGAIGQIQAALAAMKGELQNIDALRGLLSLLDPLLTGLEGIAGTSEAAFREAGLEEMAASLKPAEAVLKTGKRILSAGEQTLQAVPSLQDLADLAHRLSTLADRLSEYKAQPDASGTQQ